MYPERIKVIKRKAGGCKSPAFPAPNQTMALIGIFPLILNSFTPIFHPVNNGTQIKHKISPAALLVKPLFSVSIDFIK